MAERIVMNTNDGNFELNPENDTLYTYRRAVNDMGGLALGNAMYDHIFMRSDDGESAYYLFITSMNDETKKKLASKMLELGHECVINQDEVAECDVQAFEEIVVKPQLHDMDFVPSEWT